MRLSDIPDNSSGHNLDHDKVSKEVPRYPVPEDIEIKGKEQKDEEYHHEGRYG